MGLIGMHDQHERERAHLMDMGQMSASFSSQAQERSATEEREEVAKASTKVAQAKEEVVQVQGEAAKAREEATKCREAMENQAAELSALREFQRLHRGRIQELLAKVEHASNAPKVGSGTTWKKKLWSSWPVG